MATVLVHRYRADDVGTPVNAYLLEAPSCVVAVDATLTVSGGRRLRAAADALGKPLARAVLTHVHPDHYGGLAELLRGLDVPVAATRAVQDVVRRDDPVKEAILRPMFGDEWPRERAFPTEVVADGATATLGEIALTVTDLGPGESPADSVWALADDPRTVFCGDLAYDGMHCYLADGFTAEWLANLERMRRALPAGATLHVGHGDPAGVEILDRQRRYLEAFLAAMDEADWSDPERAGAAVVERMVRHLPTADLRFLLELSVQALGRTGVGATV